MKVLFLNKENTISFQQDGFNFSFKFILYQPLCFYHCSLLTHQVSIRGQIPNKVRKVGFTPPLVALILKIY